MIRIRPLLVAAAILCAAGLGNAATADAAELLYGVDTQNRLVTFNGDTPTSISRIPFTGLPAGEQIVGLDVRPANKQVVALSSASRLYRIDVATGAATAIGAAPFTPALAGASFGFDFNPTVDRIRVTSDARQNLRLHPDTGAAAAVDGTLTYAVGDAGASSTPRVVGSAYTNSVAGATTTSLFDIDAGRDFLALQNPPNNGTLVSVGALGVDAGDNAGFDISSVDGVAYAALQVTPSASSGLYRIDLTTGRATLVDRIGGGTPLRALAAAGTAPADTTAADARSRCNLLVEGWRAAPEWSDAPRDVLGRLQYHRSNPARKSAGRRRRDGDQRPRRHHHASRPVQHRGEEATRGEPAAYVVPRRHRPGRLGQLGHEADHASRQALGSAKARWKGPGSRGPSILNQGAAASRFPARDRRARLA